MDITIKNVRPAFILEQTQPASDVWGREVRLLSGQHYAISGASGKGKSTFLNYIFGIRHVPNGLVLLGSQDTAQINPEQRSVLRAGDLSMVFQDLQLFEHLTAKQNLVLKWERHGDVDWSTVEGWCARLGVETFLERPINRLSLGQQQRVAVVRALVQPFVWLLMDEPTSHLDQRNSALVHQLVAEVCSQRRAGSIISTLASKPDFNSDHIIYC